LNTANVHEPRARNNKNLSRFRTPRHANNLRAFFFSDPPRAQQLTCRRSARSRAAPPRPSRASARIGQQL